MTLTLADVKNRNALSGAMLSALHDAIRAADADDAVRAVVITNEGNTFCAGANLKEQSSGAAARSGGVGFETLLGAMQSSATPIIGSIKGHVVGGGNGLAAALDISIAAEDVKFGFSEVRLGVAPAVISVVCLPKMRPGQAMEAFLRGHRFPAARAAELGLINRAVPAAELDAAVNEVLDDVLCGGPRALAAAKRLVHRAPTMNVEDAFAWASKLSQELFRSEEAAEGMRAFLEKRPAAWAADPESKDA